MNMTKKLPKGMSPLRTLVRKHQMHLFANFLLILSALGQKCM